MRETRLTLLIMVLMLATTNLMAEVSGYFRSTMIVSNFSRSVSFSAMNLLSLQYDSDISPDLHFHLEGYCFFMYDPQDPREDIILPGACPNFNRFFLTYYPSSSVTIQLGKNTIHWSINQILRTQDYFTINPIISYSEEESGIYQLYTSYTGTNLSLEGIVIPQSRNKVSLGGQLSLTAGPLETKINLVHREPDITSTGLNWSLSIDPILLYGEETYFFREKKYRSTIGLSFSISDTIVYVEYLHNTLVEGPAPVTGNTTIFPIISYTSKNYLALTSQITLTPISQIDLTSIWDMDTNDWFTIVQFDYTVNQAMTISTGILSYKQTGENLLETMSFMFQFRYWF